MQSIFSKKWEKIFIDGKNIYIRNDSLTLKIFQSNNSIDVSLIEYGTGFMSLMPQNVMSYSYDTRNSDGLELKKMIDIIKFTFTTIKSTKE